METTETATKSLIPAWAMMVQELLEVRHLTRSWLAGQVGVSPAHMSDLMSGKRNPRPAHLRHIATALKIPAPWLDPALGEEDGQ